MLNIFFVKIFWPKKNGQFLLKKRRRQFLIFQINILKSMIFQLFFHKKRGKRALYEMWPTLALRNFISKKCFFVC